MTKGPPETAADAASGRSPGSPSPDSLGAGFVVAVFKEPGWTSHDVVVQIRRLLRIQRVGHTGTLDPFASGILVCCVGRATKLTNYLMDLDKTYEGYLRLGVRTDTGDRTGRVVAEAEVPSAGPEEMQRVAERFVGEIQQIPPMVSALKHRGRRLYELAREGREVAREPRRVTVHEFTILGREGTKVRFRVRCGRGTYVRTLVEDFGRALGSEATVEELTRTALGPFDLERAVSQKRILEGDAETLLAGAVSMAEALRHFPRARLTAHWVRRVREGTSPPWSVVELERPEPPEPGQRVALLGPLETLVAIARVEPVPGPAQRPWVDDRRLVLERVI
jgi:tRNA pseudouridine55 synthase